MSGSEEESVLLCCRTRFNACIPTVLLVLKFSVPGESERERERKRLERAEHG